MKKFLWTRKPNFHHSHSEFNYNKYWLAPKNLNHYLRPREVVFFKWIKPNSKVLFIGAGLSRLPYELAKQKKCKVYVNDISQPALQIQKKMGLPIIKKDYANQRLKEKYDYIVCSEVLEHLVLPEKLIKNIFKQAKYYIFSIPNIAYFPYRWHIFWAGRFITQWKDHPAEHLRYWSHKDFLDWLPAMRLKLNKTAHDYTGFNILKLLAKMISPNLFSHFNCYLCTH